VILIGEGSCIAKGWLNFAAYIDELYRSCKVLETFDRPSFLCKRIRKTGGCSLKWLLHDTVSASIGSQQMLQFDLQQLGFWWALIEPQLCLLWSIMVNCLRWKYVEYVHIHNRNCIKQDVKLRGMAGWWGKSPQKNLWDPTVLRDVQAECHGIDRHTVYVAKLGRMYGYIYI